jgi:hypothetical protein
MFICVLFIRKTDNRVLLICHLNCLFSAVNDKAVLLGSISIVFVIKLNTSNWGYFFINLNMALCHILLLFTINRQLYSL